MLDVGISSCKVLTFMSSYSFLFFIMHLGMNFKLFQAIPLAPLWDFSKGQFVGVLSALDFILILREVFLHLELSAFQFMSSPRL